MSTNCPATRFYNSMKTKFARGVEKAEESLLESCQMKCFAGRMSEKLFRKFEQDRAVREEISRGVTKNLSIMFTDIRGFTTRTFMMHPERIVRLLDLFIPEMLTIIIERHHGTVDKLLGDGILAVYGHPYATGEEIIQALHSAADMQQASAAMDSVLRMSGYDPIEIGVGINHGEVLICEVGNDAYRESTVIGAPVNMAAKMEDVAKASEIALPADLLPTIEKLKPRMAPYFSSIGEQHGVGSVIFDWVKYIENEPQEFKDWKIG
jgi:class 3 adenylate cyclase